MLEAAILIRKTLLHDDAVLTHLVTQRGRDHILKMSSRERSVLIATVHLELRFSLSKFPETLQLIAAHWPTPSGLGFFCWLQHLRA